MAPVLAKKAYSVKAAELDTLYILMLDKSGSMSGKPWKDLMNAVTEFLQVFEADPTSLASSRVTILSYDHICNINYDNAVPSSNMTKSIPFSGGFTNFDAPLR